MVYTSLETIVGILDSTYFALRWSRTTEGMADKTIEFLIQEPLYYRWLHDFSKSRSKSILSITAIAERAMDQILLKTLRFLMKITVINQ
jgi:hypothetical protein